MYNLSNHPALVLDLQLGLWELIQKVFAQRFLRNARNSKLLFIFYWQFWLQFWLIMRGELFSSFYALTVSSATKRRDAREDGPVYCKLVENSTSRQGTWRNILINKCQNKSSFSFLLSHNAAMLKDIHIVLLFDSMIQDYFGCHLLSIRMA